MTDWGGHHPDCASGAWAPRYRPDRDPQRQGRSSRPTNSGTRPPSTTSRRSTQNGVTMIISNKERWASPGRAPTAGICANRGKHDASPKDAPRLQDRTRRDPPVRERQPLSATSSTASCSRKPTAAPVEVAHRSITICHLGNIAMRLGRETLQWDPVKEQIVGDDEAAKMLSRPYRGPPGHPGRLTNLG